MNQKFKTREEWLQAAAAALTAVFKASDPGVKVPDMRISIGWPSRKALSKKAPAIGECWDKKAADDSMPHVFISPLVKDVTGAQGILATLVHEMVHGIVGNKCKHAGPFKKLARAVGLEGKITATSAGAALLSHIASIAIELGDYPFGGLNPGGLDDEDKPKKQSTRMIKCQCETCGYTIRTTSKWLEVGPPICPCNKEPMLAEQPKDADTDGGEEGEDESE